MNEQIMENRPLQQLVHDSRLEMLEAALPFIVKSLQEPLAMYIKIREMEHVREGFQHPDTVSACGLNNSNQGIEQMLRAMRGKADEDTRSQIDQMLNIIQISKMLPLLMQNSSPAPGSDEGQNFSPGQEAFMNQLLEMMKTSRT